MDIKDSTYKLDAAQFDDALAILKEERLTKILTALKFFLYIWSQAM